MPHSPRIIFSHSTAALVTAVAIFNATAVEPARTKLWYDAPASDWSEALPLGNGRLGAMVFGGPALERLQLNEETIWTGAPGVENDYRCDGPQRLPEIRRLVFENKWSEAQALFGEAMVQDTWFARYQPMCDLWIEFPGHTEGDRIHVDGADGALILLAAGTNFRSYRDVSGDPGPAIARQLATAAKKPLPDLRGDHVAAHHKLFERVSLTLPESTAAKLPTDARLEKVRDGQEDPALAALLFQYGRYLLISSARPGTGPPNLQGIWCGERNPARDSKYTTNINLEMNFWPTNVANLAECIDPLARFAQELSVTGGWAARHGYRARGWTLNFNTDQWRNA